MQRSALPPFPALPSFFPWGTRTRGIQRAAESVDLVDALSRFLAVSSAAELDEVELKGSLPTGTTRSSSGSSGSGLQFSAEWRREEVPLFQRVGK